MFPDSDDKYARPDPAAPAQVAHQFAWLRTVASRLSRISALFRLTPELADFSARAAPPAEADEDAETQIVESLYTNHHEGYTIPPRNVSHGHWR
jgi:hypothetical protein